MTEIVDFRAGLRAYLLGDVDIASAVEAARIYPVVLPQGETRDAVSYQRISALGDYHMEGPSGLISGRVQINAWSKDADRATRLANLIKKRIDGFKGEMEFSDDSPNNAVTVQAIFFADREDDIFDDASKLYGVRRDYFIWFEEA